MIGLLVYDGDCAFCSSAVSFAHRWISPDTETVPWQWADLAALGLTADECQAAVQYRDRHGRWTSAGPAVAALLRDGRPPWAWLGRIAALPGVAWLVQRTYAWVAKNRHTLPGGTPACHVPNKPS